MCAGLADQRGQSQYLTFDRVSRGGEGGRTGGKAIAYGCVPVYSHIHLGGLFRIGARSDGAKGGSSRTDG